MEANVEREPALLEIKANLDFENHKKHYRFITRKNPRIWISWIAALLMALLLYFSYNWELLAIPAALLVYLIILSATAPRRSYRHLPKILAESASVYTFYRDDFQVVRTIQLLTNVQTIRYEFIKLVHETDSAFYLQSIDPNLGMYVLDKKDFTPGQMETLRELFAEKLKK